MCCAVLQVRMTKLMAGTGLSVAITLLASTVAFALGTISSLPSIQWFSVYATMSTIMIAVMGGWLLGWVGFC